jgi:hypothetical protein
LNSPADHLAHRRGPQVGKRCPRGTEKKYEKPSITIAGGRDRHFNPGPPEYEEGVFITLPRCSVESGSFKKIMHYLSIYKILPLGGLRINLNDSCCIDAFLIESCPAVVLALYLLSLKLTPTAYETELPCIRRLNIFHFRFFLRGKCRQTIGNFLFGFKKHLLTLFPSRMRPAGRSLESPAITD